MCYTCYSVMSLTTTVIGSFPKPSYLPTPDWFRGELNPAKFNDTTSDINSLHLRALQDVLKEQEEIGVDVLSDGEVCRENYIHHFCRSLDGMDMVNCVYMKYREGACAGYLPRVVGQVKPKDHASICVPEWEQAQLLTSHDVKMTIPGPMTICNTVCNEYYDNKCELQNDLITCVNREVQALAQAGCRHIQIDEPMLVRDPEAAIKYGISNMAKCFQGVGAGVEKIVHLCCGYPTYLDQEDYMKADKNVYLSIAQALDDAGFDAVSLEDAHEKNDLDLFSRFKKTKVILGVVAISKSRIEPTDEIYNRVKNVLTKIPKSKLVLAPDCGLGYLPRDILRSKLQNMVNAARLLRSEMEEK